MLIIRLYSSEYISKQVKLGASRAVSRLLSMEIGVFHGWTLQLAYSASKFSCKGASTPSPIFL